ncbi:MAG: iron-containing alcohol dehydrogenase, partial [Roseiflexaceae bacterium]
MTTTSYYIWPGQVHVGFGVARRAGAEAHAEGARNVFVIADPGVVAAGLLEPVIASLAEAGLAYVVYDRVVPNPDTASVDAAAAAFRASAGDLIVG